MPAQFDHLEASFSSKKLVQSSEPSCENYTVVVPLLKTRMKPLPSQLRMNHTSLQSYIFTICQIGPFIKQTTERTFTGY